MDALVDVAQLREGATYVVRVALLWTQRRFVEICVARLGGERSKNATSGVLDLLTGGSGRNAKNVKRIVNQTA